MQNLKTHAVEALTDFTDSRLGFKDLIESSVANQEKFAETFEEIADLVQDNSEQKANLQAVRDAFEEWKNLERSVAKNPLPHDVGSAAFQAFHSATRKLRGQILQAADEMIARERIIRVQRQDKTRAVAVSLVVTIGILVLLLASVFALFGRNAIRQVSNTYAHALNAEQSSRTKAESAADSREQFMSMASHELKTPLSALKLQLELLERKNRSQDIQTFPGLDSSLELALRQVRTLNSLVDDLLDTSRIESGQMNLDPAPTDLSEVVEDISRRLKDQLKMAKCSLELHLQKPLVGQWDVRRLEQIVANLLSNAIKYAPEKSIHITASKHGDLAILTVEDSGPGIEKDLQSKIFERFERGNSKLKASGLGLGLFIVKNIVETKGGRIYVESEPGRGSKFFVELPLETA